MHVCVGEGGGLLFLCENVCLFGLYCVNIGCVCVVVVDVVLILEWLYCVHRIVALRALYCSRNGSATIAAWLISV